MAYNRISQSDENDGAFQSHDLDLADRSPLEPPPPSTDESIASAQRALGSLISGIKNKDKPSSYEMVEEVDYDEPANRDEATPTVGAEIAQPRSTSPEPLVRTSSDVSIPLRHPTPDLQSLQGAYIGNIERLEKSAERLSMTSSDLGLELRKLDLEQKRRSSASSVLQAPESPTRQMSIGSIANSIIAVNSAARSGGYSPGGFMSSPRGSILSGSRFRSTSVTSPLQDIQEPKQEDDMEMNTVEDSEVPILTPAPLPADTHNDEPNSPDAPVAAEANLEFLDRPLTAHSTDTYQQATDLFLDFDGVHFVPHPRDKPLSRQLSLNKPPRATTAEHYKEPQAGQNLIYYPAPIPQMLNLPQRLSKQPAKPNYEKHRTQFMDTITDKKNDPKADSAAEERVKKRLSTLPPQLRASMFFDQPSSKIASLGVEVKDHSAVYTLDSILDASAFAPVTAFTDHPIAGSAAGNVYSSHDKKRASRLDAYMTTAGPHESVAFPTAQTIQKKPDHSDVADSDDDHDSRSHQSSDASSVDSNDSGNKPDDDGGTSEGEEEEEEEDYETEDPILFGRPTTLLAELQMRKEEQKQRNRTAAKAFPNGMHSTLLELDAVAQAQSNKRRQKAVTLAWETEAVENSDNADDEDVPLGLLYGNREAAAEERPLGLMERREMEENEPLSSRRARLRGETAHRAMQNNRASTMSQLQSNTAAAEFDSGDEGETLAQRIRRLKQEKKDKTKSIVSVEFENEIMAELGKLNEPIEPDATEKLAASEPVEKNVDEEEETLGQRRKRLQAEAQGQKSQTVKNVRASRSMADILQAYPAKIAQSPSGNYQDRQISTNPGFTHTNRMSTSYGVSANMAVYPGSAQPPGYSATYGAYEAPPAYGHGTYNPSFVPGGINVYNAGMQYPSHAAMMQQIIDPRQRDVIDRWRQSVAR